MKSQYLSNVLVVPAEWRILECDQAGKYGLPVRHFDGLPGQQRLARRNRMIFLHKVRQSDEIITLLFAS